MAQFSNNRYIFFDSGWCLRPDGVWLPTKLVDQVGLPHAEWIQIVQNHLEANKARLAIRSVDLVPGPINQDPRVSFKIAFDTDREKVEDAYILFEATLGAIQKNPSTAVAFYDWPAALKAIEEQITIYRG